MIRIRGRSNGAGAGIKAREEKPKQEVVGLIPAGGYATRIAPLPCSKELYPIGFRPADQDNRVLPKVVCHYLLEKMQAAEINKAYIVLREGKWDIPTYLRDGTMFGIHLAYLLVNSGLGVPYTLDQAYPFVKNSLVAFGFPDVLFDCKDSFRRLLAKQSAGTADAVLGLFPADRPQNVDMVDFDNKGRVRRIIIKPRKTSLVFSWIIAVWTPVFTRFMHDYLVTISEPASELFLWDVLQAALRDGLRIDAVPLSDAPFLDIGTPEDLVRAVRGFAIGTI